MKSSLFSMLTVAVLAAAIGALAANAVSDEPAPQGGSAGLSQDEVQDLITARAAELEQRLDGLNATSVPLPPPPPATPDALGETAPAPAPKSGDLQAEVAALRTEVAELKKQLASVQAQGQKAFEKQAGKALQSLGQGLRERFSQGWSDFQKRQDQSLQEALGVTDDQFKRLKEIEREQWDTLGKAFQEFREQGLDREKMTERFQQLQKDSDDKMRGVLDENQLKEYKKRRNPQSWFRGGFGRGNRGNRGNRNGGGF